MIQVLPNGTPVKVGMDINGIITGINIRGESYVTYAVSWWDGRQYREGWFIPQEVTTAEPTETRAIGFLANGPAKP